MNGQLTAAISKQSCCLACTVCSYVHCSCIVDYYNAIVDSSNACRMTFISCINLHALAIEVYLRIRACCTGDGCTDSCNPRTARNSVVLYIKLSILRKVIFACFGIQYACLDIFNIITHIAGNRLAISNIRLEGRIFDFRLQAACIIAALTSAFIKAYISCTHSCGTRGQAFSNLHITVQITFAVNIAKVEQLLRQTA